MTSVGTRPLSDHPPSLSRRCSLGGGGDALTHIIQQQQQWTQVVRSTVRPTTIAPHNLASHPSVRGHCPPAVVVVVRTVAASVLAVAAVVVSVARLKV